MPTPTSSNHCLRYWDLADHIRIDDAIALWCGVEPAELAKLNFETQCMSAKRAALVTALRDGRLGYEDLGLLTGQGKVFRGAPVDELIEKGRLVINKASLRRWFEQLPFDDRPAFLFEEERQPVLPDGSDIAEMTGLKATRREFVAALKAELPTALRHLQSGNIAPVDLAQAAIGPGMGVYTRYSKVVDAQGNPVSVREALTLINHVLDETLAEQEGDFDTDSRFALAWFEQHGFEEGEFGVANVLAQAKNTGMNGLVESGILASSRGRVRLLRADELPEDWDPATDPRLTAWEVVH